MPDKRKKYAPMSAEIAADVRTIGMPRSSIGGNDAKITVASGIATMPHSVVAVTSTAQITLQIIPVGNDARSEAITIPANELTATPIFDRIVVAGSTGYNTTNVSYWS